MRHRVTSLISRTPSFALGFIACLFLLGGTAVAAHFITGKQIKNGSLTGVDVKNKSLTAKDFKGSVAGTQGPAGATGATGPAGDGVLVKDATGATLGQLIDDPSVASLQGPTIVTPGGYVVTLGWDGSLPPETTSISFPGPNCQGPSQLGTGAGSAVQTTSTKRLIYESSPGVFQVPASPKSGTVGIGSYHPGDGSCMNINSVSFAWPLKPVSHAATGLPATITGPIELAAD